MGRTEKSQNFTRKRSTVRRLRFDSLEDRRLLAGLQVYVFEDQNASGGQDPGESPLSGRVLFLDSNQNGALDRDEAWRVTDEAGVASFADLPLGTYHPTLLGVSRRGEAGMGNNPSQIQTTPVAMETTGFKTSVDGAFELVGWVDESSVLIRKGNTFRQVALNQQESPLPTLTLEGTLDAYVIDGQGQDATRTGVAILVRDNGDRELVGLDLQSMVSRGIFDSRGIEWKQVVSLGDRWIAAQQTASGLQLVEVNLQDRSIVSLPNALLPAESQLIGFGSHLLVRTQGAAPEMQLYSLAETGLELLSSRAVSASIVAADPAGRYLVVDGGLNGWEVLDAQAGFATQLALDSSIRAVMFQPELNAILAYDQLAGQLIRMRYGANFGELSRENLPGLGLAERSSLRRLSFSPFYQTLVGELPTGLYSVAYDLPVTHLAPLETPTQNLVLRYGLRTIGENRKPSISMPESLSWNEDTTYRWTKTQWNGLAQDLDGDRAFLFITQGPQHGKLEWSLNQPVSVIPNPNFEGADALVVRAFDGRDWSEPMAVTLNVAGINDLPSNLLLTADPIGEHATSEDRLGVVSVVDPDADADYLITVSDPRFLVVDGQLRLAPGQTLDFEQAAQITLEFAAEDQTHGDSITRSFVLPLRDENDPVTGIQFELQPVDENQLGAALGSVRPIDQDGSDLFTWQLSDPRFEIVNGILKLKPDVSLNFEQESSVGLTISVQDQGNLSPVNQFLSIQVTDRNDPIEDIVISGGVIPERIRGASVGTVVVIDQDVGEEFDFTVSDSRFVVHQGVLKLKPDQYLLASEAATITVQVTATSRLHGDSLTKAKTLAVRNNALPWQNPIDPLDVNGDGVITPLDPLRVINYLNLTGIQRLAAEGEPGGDFVDVNGDGYVSPLDVLILINELNNRPRGGGGTGGTGGGSGGSGEGESSVDSPSAPLLNDTSLASYLEDQDGVWGPKRRRGR